MTNVAIRYEDPQKYSDKIQQGRILCNCGHRIILPPKVDKVVCHWCGNYIFRNKKAEFEYRINQEMRRNK